MKDKLHQKRISLFFMCFILLISTMFMMLSYSLIPNELYLLSGKDNILEYNLPVSVNILSENNETLQVNGNISSSYNVSLNEPLTVKSEESGTVDLKLKIFGILPASVKVKMLPDIKLYPGGQLVGVKLETEGVIIVGLQELEAVDGKKYNPGKDSKLMLGDIVYKINNKEVNTAQEVTKAVNNLSKENVKLDIHRNGKKQVVKISPIKCKSDDTYRLGLWVRDNTAGIGTMTFFEDESNKFGALGHPITDITTNIIIPVKDGSIVSSKVLSILPGKSGTPGEIRGVFYNEDKILGHLSKNTENGVFGELTEGLENKLYNQPLDISLQNDVKIGKAQILTTLENDEVEAFDVNIEKINLQSRKSAKGLVVRVTDKKLLEETGGIIQGMSGSPIIQNGKIVGAVTHVFVNDPTKGYGVFIEWMLEEAGIAFVE